MCVLGMYMYTCLITDSRTFLSLLTIVLSLFGFVLDIVLPHLLYLWCIHVTACVYYFFVLNNISQYVERTSNSLCKDPGFQLWPQNHFTCLEPFQQYFRCIRPISYHSLNCVLGLSKPVLYNTSNW